MTQLIFRYFPNPPSPELEKIEKRIFRVSIFIPALFVVFFWLVKLFESVMGYRFYLHGIYPRNNEGLWGIVFSPFIHGDFSHLANNSATFFVLGTALFFFYRKHALFIFFLNFFMSGAILWLIGRPTWHIGASGVIYGMAAFLFFSGLFRRDMRLLTISLIITFLYGSLFWGLLPIDPRISWEGHLAGAFSGTLLALWFRNQGPPRKKFEWEEAPDEESSSGEGDDEYWNVPLMEEKKNATL
jgi:membrane associated rhomboid family serine protease